MFKKWIATFRHTNFVLLIFLVGCASMQRDCAKNNAESFGADWVVVTNGADGRIVNCWKLQNVSIANEEHSDGIYWESNNKHLIHISGWYIRVQVRGGDYEGAAKEIGVDLARCPGGRYLGESGAAVPSKPTIGTAQDGASDIRIVNADFEDGHTIRAVFGAHDIKELRVDDKVVAPNSLTGQAAIRAVYYKQLLQADE